MYRESTTLFVFFFFSSRRRHTRLQGDWSSDVCSSDLLLQGRGRDREIAARVDHPESRPPRRGARDVPRARADAHGHHGGTPAGGGVATRESTRSSTRSRAASSPATTPIA